MCGFGFIDAQEIGQTEFYFDVFRQGGRVEDAEHFVLARDPQGRGDSLLWSFQLN